MTAQLLEPTDDQLLDLEQNGFKPTIDVDQVLGTGEIADPPDADDILESLFEEADSRRIRKPPKPAKPLLNTKLLYSDPKNWKRSRGIAIIHAETQTLLGNFSEFVHLRVPNCRKLVRESSPITVEAIEEVAGSWWLEPKIVPKKRQPTSEEKRITFHLHLEELGVYAPATELVIHLEHNGIRRIELAADTMLAGNGLLFLPKGTNLLEILDQDSKVRIRMEIGL